MSGSASSLEVLLLLYSVDEKQFSGGNVPGPLPPLQPCSSGPSQSYASASLIEASTDVQDLHNCNCGVRSMSSFCEPCPCRKAISLTQHSATSPWRGRLLQVLPILPALMDDDSDLSYPLPTSSAATRRVQAPQSQIKWQCPRLPRACSALPGGGGDFKDDALCKRGQESTSDTDAESGVG